MINLHQAFKTSTLFKKLEVDNLLYVEYTCMQEETKYGIWSDSNYFAFIASGKKMWRTTHQDYLVEDGDILFVKKGANLTHQYFDDDFCAVFFFIPDAFIQSFLSKYPHFLNLEQQDLSAQDAVLRIDSDSLLEGYYQSILTYLNLPNSPDQALLKLKFEELLLNFFTNHHQLDLRKYLISLSQNKDYSMSRIMEENYAYNLKLEEYAQLCQMSLSTFKKAFKAYYNQTPGAWIKTKKLELACQKLLGSAETVNQVAFECGYEDPSHFIRIFKQRFHRTPHQFRLQKAVP